MVCFTSGCGNNDYPQESVKTSGNSYDANNNISSSYALIDDFYLETDKNNKLEPSKLNRSEFNDLISKLETDKRINWYEQYFQLNQLSNYDKKTSLRKTELDGETCYYCIYENITDEQKAYLFFTPIEDLWTCQYFVIFDKYGTLVPNERYSFTNQKLEYIKSIIAEIDLD